MSETPLKSGPEIIDEMVTEPTLDAFFDANPNTLDDKQLMHMINILRERRALYIKKEMDK